MKVVYIPTEKLIEAAWSPNRMDLTTEQKLRESIRRYELVGNLVVRLKHDRYEVLSGNHRLRIIRELGIERPACVVVDLDDAHARVLSQALNRVHGEDDLGLRAELVRHVLNALPEEAILTFLPETSESLKALTSLGQDETARHLENWQEAQRVRLHHSPFAITSSQLEVIKEALAKVVPRAKEEKSDSPNLRGTALYVLCRDFLEKEGE